MGTAKFRTPVEASKVIGRNKEALNAPFAEADATKASIKAAENEKGDILLYTDSDN